MSTQPPERVANPPKDKESVTLLPLPLAEEPNLILRFQRDVEMTGLVGEKKNASVVFLVGVSASLLKPLNASVGGASAAGKNQLTGSVATFIPEERKKILTGMTPKVLMHSKEDEFQHKAVFITEYEGVAGADYAIRTMQSERLIEWEFVESSSTGLQKKTKRVKGPAAFIQATTRSTLHPENETRLLFLQIDESIEQTRAINERQALEAEMKLSSYPADLLEQWHELFRSLEHRQVRIPYASQLANQFPGRVQSRRDFPKLLALIEASAYLHQHQRQKDESGNIVAAWQDYQIAKELFEHCYQAGPEKKVAELVQAASKAVGRYDGKFTAADLMEQTGWGKSKVYQVLDRAQEMGLIVPADQRGEYRLLNKDVDHPLNLPAKIKLKADFFRSSTKGGGR
jgi:hypothetical protein